MSERERIKEVLSKALEPMFRGHSWLACRNDWINAKYWRTEDGERKLALLTIDINKLADALIPLMQSAPPSDNDAQVAGTMK